MPEEPVIKIDFNLFSLYPLYNFYLTKLLLQLVAALA